MTFVSIVNPPASRTHLKVIEDFGSYSVQRCLAPGESLSLPVSRYKAVVVVEATAAAIMNAANGSTIRSASEDASPRPLELRVG